MPIFMLNIFIIIGFSSLYYLILFLKHKHENKYIFENIIKFILFLIVVWLISLPVATHIDSDYLPSLVLLILGALFIGIDLFSKSEVIISALSYWVSLIILIGVMILWIYISYLGAWFNPYSKLAFFALILNIIAGSIVYIKTSKRFYYILMGIAVLSFILWAIIDIFYFPNTLY